ncbi:hypothetical protein RJ639_032402 [Escallonia herrerae]|uniref:WAT1-related protein n=1 Tax=Escallonia herrerae TaxID=1293975 RepID=A0AA89B8A1_9ASTE|nr:hypothetical protein RJ639_032402 [Escallonia herrerae]
MAKQGRYCYKEVLPFAAMIFLQCTQVALSIIFKAATLKGMSYRVFIVYSYALSGLVLLPFAFIFERASSQLCGYKGIEYSSPTLASAISNLAPAFTFVLAIFCRMEKIEIRSLSSQAKIIGTILSILGALVVVIYKGPTLVRTSSNVSVLLYQPLKSSESDWIAGGLLLTADYVLFSIWYIVQTDTVRKYPAELIVVSLYNLCVAIIAAPISYILESDSSAWKGLYGSSFATVILTWALRLKGPVYVALFTPLSIAIAAIMSGIFLGDSLYLGSVVGAVIISVGFYVVIWGKAKEDLVEDEGLNSSEPPSPETDPLLQ